jgi:hypothetical protein
MPLLMNKKFDKCARGEGNKKCALVKKKIQTSALIELLEESEQFRFLRAACVPNIKGSVGLILATVSAMRISIPLDLSSRPFIPLPCFIRSRRPTPLLTPSLVFPPRISA